MDNFYKWGTSLAGCEGGNLELSDTWICGVELGKSEVDLEVYYAKIRDDVSRGLVESEISNYKYSFANQNTDRFGLSFSKLYSVINGYNVADHEDYTSQLSGDEIFKLNLYPVAFNNFNHELWTEKKMHELSASFSSKEDYKLWCKLNRFPRFKKLVDKQAGKKLKRIICIGLSSLADFLDALYIPSDDYNDKVESRIIENENQSQKPRRIICAQMKNGVYFYVLPFPTSSMGLNGDFLLDKVGREIRAFESL